MQTEDVKCIYQLNLIKCRTESCGQENSQVNVVSGDLFSDGQSILDRKSVLKYQIFKIVMFYVF